MFNGSIKKNNVPLAAQPPNGNGYAVIMGCSKDAKKPKSFCSSFRRCLRYYYHSFLELLTLLKCYSYYKLKLLQKPNKIISSIGIAIMLL